MTNARNKQLLEDRYQSHPLLGELKAVLQASESFATNAASVKADAHLSVAGRNAKIETQVRAALRDMRELSAPLDAKRAQLADVLAKIRPASFDKLDMAGALLRQEMRGAVKGMSLSERAAILLGDHADVAFVDAVLEASPILSGLDSSLYEGVREQRLEGLFGAESLEAESLSTQIQESNAIFELARQDIEGASGLQPYEFAALAKAVAERKDAVWLKRERDMNGAERVIVLEPKSAKTRLAEPDDLRDGKFYDNYAAYQADRAA
jgi:hypothetical protein